ncbi:MAG: right-handed parallel beta-helix repeat-containing protein [Bacteroidetes bacterium]|nr:right-handed parallel beta-helix repeat-containing protein [Bacteroidota bacterium]
MKKLLLFISALLLATTSVWAQSSIVFLGNTLSGSFGAWGGTGHFYSPTFNVNATGGIDITYYDIDVSQFTDGNVWSLEGVALPGVSASSFMTSIDPEKNSIWCNILNQNIASGVDWNGIALSTVGPDGIVMTSDDSRHQGTQDWYRDNTGGSKIDGPAAGPYYNNESWITPNPRHPSALAKTASELNSYDFRLRILPTGSGTYTYEMWFRMHNSAATVEGAYWVYNIAMNNSSNAWRKFTQNSDGTGNTVFPVTGLDLSSVYVFMGLGNFQDPATQTLTWGRIEVLGTPTAPPSVVWVDDNYYAGGTNNGHVWGYDAFATIQAAINGVNPNGTVNVYPGTYNQDEANGYNMLTGGTGTSNFNIFVNKSVTIQGVTALGVPITNYNDVAAFVIPKRDIPSGNLSTIFVQADNVTITGLDIVNFDSPSWNFKTISVIGDVFSIKYCNIHNGDQVACFYMYDPNYNSGTNTSHIQSYTIQDNYLDVGGTYAAGIRFSSGAGWTGSVANRIISGNTISIGSYGIEFVGPGGDPWDVYPVGAATISNNIFTGQQKGSVVAWGKYNSVEGYGTIDWDGIFASNLNIFDKAVLVKKPDNSVRYFDSGTLWFIRGIYSVIQSYPIDRVAQAGDIVNVAAGIYPEQLTITKALTLNGSDGAVLDGTTLGLQKVGVSIKSGNVTFNNIDVAHFSGNGIIVGYEASIPGNLKNVHITNCKISGIQPGYSHGFGIYVGYQSEDFKRPAASPKLTAHLDYSGLLIENNEVTDSRSSSVVLQSITGDPGTLMVRNNYIHDNDNDGIWIDCARNVNIENNTITNNPDGIYISSYGDAYILGSNWQYDWTQDQLNGPFGPMNLSITGNMIVDNNSYGGVYLQAGYPATMFINENVITGNLPVGITNELNEQVNATCNWWGSACSSGFASSIVGLVTYSPWLVGNGDDPAIPGFQPTASCIGADFEVTATITSSSPNNFCNSLALTAVPLPNPAPTGTYAYLWNTGATTQSISLNNESPDGDYSVMVTDAFSCSNATASYYFQKQNLISSYTIIGIKSVTIGDENYVVNGSVGATASDGKITVGKKSTINATGAFAKAKTITVDKTAIVPVKYYSPATVTLPTMLYGGSGTGANLNVPNNTTGKTYAGNYKDVKVGNNCNVTFTGAAFAKFEIGTNSTVTFTATPTLDFTSLKTGNGTTINFGGDVSIRTKDDVVLSNTNTFNPTGYKVVIYIDGGTGNVFQVKAGGNTTVNASVYVPLGNVNVEGDGSKHTYMTGTFIANTVTTKNKNVYWNSFDCSTPPETRPVHNGDDNIIVPEEIASYTGNMTVTAYPNPSMSFFNLKIKTESTDEIRIRIYDMLGRIVKEMKGQPDQIFKFGEEFVFGTYIAEVKQGDQKVMVRLVRQ